MYELKTEGIVLNKYNQKDNDEVIIIFTEKKGKIFVRSKGTKKISSKLKPALEIFSLNDYYFIKKNDKLKYFRLIQGNSIKIFENIRKSLNHIFLCFLLVQLINKFLETEDPHFELYKITKEIFELIDKNAVNLKTAEVFFKIKLLKYTGFNIKDNKNVLKKEKLSNYLKDIIFEIEAEDSLIRDYNTDNLFKIDNILNDYIKSILNEDLSCLRLLK